jgi:leucine dehydrogenase
MEQVRMETDHVTGISVALGGSGDPSPVTAMGTYEGMKAGARRKWGTESLHDRHITVQGVGHVGYYLVQHLAHEGAEVTVTDIDAEKVELVVKEFGVNVCGLDEIYDVPCDVYAPCALGGTVNDDTIERLRCQLIAGSANNVLQDEEVHGQRLRELGILYCPDFVINAGGLINVANELEGYNQERALRQAAGIHGTIDRIFAYSDEHQVPTYLAANQLAERRIRRLGKVKGTFLGPTVRKFRGIC